MKYDFTLDDKTTLDSLAILINQCWKTLPIFEGKNKEGDIAYSRDEAYENYQKHLLFLSTKLIGASELWQNNQYYVELLYMIEGMKKSIPSSSNQLNLFDNTDNNNEDAREQDTRTNNRRTATRLHSF